MHRIVSAGLGALALVLYGSVSALAQAPAPAAEPAAPTQQTENPTVPAADATHIATLGTTAAAAEGETPRAGTAWFQVDPQNNTLRWTIEFTGVPVGNASLLCPGAPAGAGAAAGGAAGAAGAAGGGAAGGAGGAAGGAGGAAAGAAGGGAATAEGTIDLGADGTTSPIQGELTGIAAELVTAIEGGGCFVILAPQLRGPGGIRGTLTTVEPAAAPAPAP